MGIETLIFGSIIGQIIFDMSWAVAIAVVSMAVSVGYTAYAMATMPSMPGYSAEVRGRTQVVRSSVTPHRVIYGKCMVSGPLVAAFSAGDTNKFIYLVIVLASHEVEEIGEVYLGDKLSTDDKFKKSEEVRNEVLTVSSGIITLSKLPNDTPVLMAEQPVGIDGEYVDAPVPVEAYTRNGKIVTFIEGWEGIEITCSYNYDHWYAYVTKYLGTQAQIADPDLIADAKDASGNPAWTTNHKLTGRAYLVVKLEYNTDIFPQGIPNIKALVKGVNNIYDPRTETTGYTDNWALCMRDYLVKSHGLRCESDDINDEYFIAAAHVSDEDIQVLVGTGTGYVTDGAAYAINRKQIILTSGTGTILAGDIVTFAGDTNEYRVLSTMVGNILILDGDGLLQEIAADSHLAVTIKPSNTEHRYTCNGEISLDTKPIEIIRKMLTAGAGRLIWSQGKYELYPAVYNTPEDRPLTESDLRDSISVVPSPSRRDRINTVRGTYVDPAQYWQQTDFPVIQNSAALAHDGEELVTSIELPYTISCATAQRIAKIHLERALLGMTVTFPGKLTCFGYKPGNVVKLNIAQLGWVNKTFRVTDWKMSDNGGVDLMLKEDSP